MGGVETKAEWKDGLLIVEQKLDDGIEVRREPDRSRRGRRDDREPEPSRRLQNPCAGYRSARVRLQASAACRAWSAGSAR